jgi:hypothetical protein
VVESLLMSLSQNENPYQSPTWPTVSARAESVLRKRARRSLRVATGMLLIPALYNYWAFDALAVSPLPADLARLFRTLNLLGLALAFALIWLFGLAALEASARLVRRMLANGIDRDEWQEVLYKKLAWAAYLAIPGAALWAIWVFGFYQMRIDFQTISWAVGVPAHLLAACLYLPLVYGWYQLARWPVRSASA